MAESHDLKASRQLQMVKLKIYSVKDRIPLSLLGQEENNPHNPRL